MLCAVLLLNWKFTERYLISDSGRNWMCFTSNSIEQASQIERERDGDDVDDQTRQTATKRLGVLLVHRENA